MLGEATPRSGFFEPAEFNAVEARLPVEVRPVARVAYITGWRLASEIVTRQWRHVDFAAGFVRLDPGETKNGKGRMSPSPPSYAASWRRRGRGRPPLNRRRARSSRGVPLDRQAP